MPSPAPAIRENHLARLFAVQPEVVSQMRWCPSSGVGRVLQFVSSDITRIPKYGPEEINFGAVVERQLIAYV